MRIRGFPPVARADARCLILGTMPGKASLAATRYYAHPRNAFWPIVERLHGLPAGSPYEARLGALQAAGLALWDVLDSCVRPSSLDADIQRGTARPNDIRGFLLAHPGVRVICFNGGPAALLFERLVLPTLTGAQRSIERLRLPSTSPAHARMGLEQKLQAWSVIRSAGLRSD